MTRPVTARAKLLLVALASAAVSLTSPALASADVSGDLTYTNAGDHVVVTGCVGGAASCPASLVIPGTIASLPVTEIDGSAFENASSVTSVVMTTGLQKIGADAFHKVQFLTSVVMPDTVYWIGDEAFYEDRALTSVTLPTSLTQLGGGSFANTGVKSISIPSGVTRINDCTFASSAIETIVLPPTLTSIGNCAFNGASKLTSINIPADVEGIGNEAFRGASSLTSITIPAKVTGIGSGAFRDATNLATVNFLGNALQLIANDTFRGASQLTSINIPSNVEGIGDNAFRGASSLTSITIPAKVTGIANTVFRDATSLATVNFLGNAPYLAYEPFQNVAPGAKAQLAACTLTGYGVNGDLFGGLIVSGGKASAAATCAPATGGTVVSKFKLGGRSGNLSVPFGHRSVAIAFSSAQRGTFTLKVMRGSRVYKRVTGSVRYGANTIRLLTSRLAASKYRVVLSLSTTPSGRRARNADIVPTKTTVSRYLTVKASARFSG